MNLHGTSPWYPEEMVISRDSLKQGENETQNGGKIGVYGPINHTTILR